MLPTILSRCRRIDLRPAPAQTISEFLIERYEVSAERAQEIAGASSGKVGWAVEAARDSGLLERVRQTVDTIDEFTRGSLTDRFEYAQQLAARFSANRETVFADLDLWQSWWRDILLTGHKRSELVSNVAKRDSLEEISAKLSVDEAAAAVDAVRRAVFLLERNVSPRLALEAMMLALPRV
jgi:DNA polymerase-3 subunit delta'